MKKMNKFLIRPTVRGWVLGLAATALSSYVATAMPYATSLTNSGGVVSFRLNQTTATNDIVMVLSSGGAVTNYLQKPANNTNNVVKRGLIVTNLNVAAGTIKVVIKHIGSGVVKTNSPIVAFSAPRGVAVNQNTNSPYFGWVYAARGGAGIFVYGSDLSDITGQGATAKTGGYPFSSSSTSWTPYRISVAPDDTLLVCDDSDYSGNLLGYNPLCTSYQYVLQQLSAAGAGVSPVTSNNVHGSLSSAVIVGTGANRKLYTVDEDYQTDPTSTSACEWNSTWRYDIGNSPWPYTNPPSAKLMTPYEYNANGQNEELSYGGANGFLYFFQRRANLGQYGAYIMDPNNIIDPTNYPCAKGGYFWSSQDESIAEGWPDDLMRDLNGIAVSPDGRWLAFIYYETLNVGGNGGLTNTITGEVWAPAGNDLVILPLTNGVPEFSKRIRVTGQLGTTAAGRGIAFDAADNLYAVSSGMALLQSFDLGQSGTATTGSDGTFNLDVPATTVSVQATTPVAYEQGTVPGVFTLTRQTGALIPPKMTLAYTLSGTALNGTDYTNLSGSVTFANGALSTNIYVKPIDDSIPELTESVTLTIATDPSGTNYNVGIPAAATVYLVDNDTPQLRILSCSTRMYEANPYDFTLLQIERWGNTNIDLVLDTSNFTCTGSAVSNLDYYVTNLPVTIPAGTVRQTIALLGPIDNALLDGTRTINLTMLAGAGFTVISNTATVNIIDDEVPAETVLWSDNLQADTSTNYTWVFASTNGDNGDYSLSWAYDYVNGLGIPPAPLSPAATTGLRLTVNKQGGYSAAGLNLYPTNQSFSGNYALRFDMYLLVGTPATYTTEYAIFGINHSGTKTNWFRNSGTGWADSSYDGVWGVVEADASGTDDYLLFSSPTVSNGGTYGPTYCAAAGSGAFTQTFQSPPWYYGGVSGSPANLLGSSTPSWAQVELKQVNGVITLTINKATIMTYTNTTAYTSGYIMLGYNDAYDSIGAADSSVIYANARVVSLAVPVVTKIGQNGSNLEITFTANAGDVPSQFVLQQSSPLATGAYADTTSVITSLGGGAFKAVKAIGASPTFYRVRRLY